SLEGSDLPLINRAGPFSSQGALFFCTNWLTAVRNLNISVRRGIISLRNVFISGDSRSFFVRRQTISLRNVNISADPRSFFVRPGTISLRNLNISADPRSFFVRREYISQRNRLF